MIKRIVEISTWREKSRPPAGFFLKKITRALLLIFILLPILTNLKADEVLVLHEAVGAEVDIIEKVHYRLFPDIHNFISAQFYLLPNDSVVARIQSWNAAGPVVSYHKFYSLYEFHRLGQEIASQAPPDRDKIEFLQRKYKPLFAEEHLRRLPSDSYCLIRTKNRNEYQGLFVKLSGQNIHILDGDQLLAIPVASIATLKYWEVDQPVKILQWATLAGFASIGLTSGQLIAILLKIPVHQTGLYLFSGAVVGIAAGYHAIPVVVEKLRPKTVIEFRKSKIKRLDSIGRITYTFKKLKGKICRTRESDQD